MNAVKKFGPFDGDPSTTLSCRLLYSWPHSWPQVCNRELNNKVVV